MNCLARFSASALIAASPCGGFLSSALMLPCQPDNKKPRSVSGAGLVLGLLDPSVQLDALFLEILERTGMPGDRRSSGLLILELDVLRLLVREDQVGALVEEGLDDVVHHLVRQARVRHQDV